MPCSLVEVHTRFRGTYCFHLQNWRVSHENSCSSLLLDAWWTYFSYWRWKQYTNPKHNVTDLINALSSNSSVNTVEHATIEEAVFSVSAVTSRSGGWWSRDICFLWCVSVPWLYKWQNSGTCQFSVGDSHGKFVVEEEYKKSAYEDLTCDLKTLYVL
jgi:hypothetical protein